MLFWDKCLSLPPGVKLLVEPLQAFPRDVGIYLGSGQVGMTQHHLNAAQVRPVLQQMGGKGMAKGVGRNILEYPRLSRPFLDDVPERLPAHGGT